jgi:FkbM family methyltransferase
MGMSMKQKIKDTLRKFPAAFEISRRVYKFFVPVSVPETPADRARKYVATQIRKAFSKQTPVFFLQVGSNDGVRSDPLHSFRVNNRNWTGIFIEPVEPIFERLKRNYQFSDRFIFENVAIGPSRETRKFYYVSEDAKELGGNISLWYDQLGSFDKTHILKHCIGRNSGFASYIVEQEVKCVLLQDILDKHRVTKIDLIHIDTEGFDYGVLSQIDFNKYRPSIVLYEHYHISVDEKEKAESLLKTHGYTLFELEEDTLAVFRS